MPTYSYRCDSKCNATYDIKQKFEDPVLQVCPECGGNKFKKLIIPPLGVTFNGSGFYTTDNRKK